MIPLSLCSVCREYSCPLVFMNDCMVFYRWTFSSCYHHFQLFLLKKNPRSYGVTKTQARVNAPHLCMITSSPIHNLFVLLFSSDASVGDLRACLSAATQNCKKGCWSSRMWEVCPKLHVVKHIIYLFIHLIGVNNAHCIMQKREKDLLGGSRS